MQRRPSVPSWPHVGIVTSLFVMSMLAVHAWRSGRPDTPLSDVPTAASVTSEPARASSTDPVREKRFGATISAASVTPPLPGPEPGVAAAAIADAPAVPGPVAARAPREQPTAAKPAAAAAMPAEPTSPPRWTIRLTAQPGASTHAATPAPAPPKAVVATPPSRVEPAQAPAPAEPPSPWPEPVTLTAQLEGLRHTPHREWAEQVLAQLRALRRADSLASPLASTALERLRTLDLQATTRRNDIGSIRPPVTPPRTRYALRRRLDVWQTVCAIAQRHGGECAAPNVDPDALRQRADDVAALLEGRTAEKNAWRTVLALAEIRAAAQARDDRHRPLRQLARRVLAGVQRCHLSDAQLRFLNQPAVAALVEQLRRWAYLPVQYDHLLSTMERFESAGSASARSEFADQWDRLRFSPWPGELRLAAQLDAHYRNANVRLAATQELINGLVPEVQASEEPVFDRILGARVTGRSMTHTRLRVRLVPDPRHVRFRFEARGVVTSSTKSAKGPVTFLSNGRSTYVAQKEFLLDRTGLRSMPAEAVAQSRNQVKDVQTDFDGILLVASVVRSIARDQQREQRDQLRAEVDWRVTHRACRRLDNESQQRLTVAQQRAGSRWLEPLRQLQLEPVALETRTTNRRMIVRGRLAGAHQLAAFTPRPQAPANSQASLQVHQSLVNNTLEQMGLDGSRNDLRGLYRRILDRIGRPDVPVVEEVPRRVTIEFAPRDAVRVAFCDGRMTLELRIAELVSRSRKWRDFAVRVHYREQLDGLEARLVRDGTIELKGKRLGIRNQIALRGIFTKVFGRDRVISVIPAGVDRDPRFSNLEVCQWTVRDGWLAVAVARKRQPRAHVAKSRPPERK